MIEKLKKLHDMMDQSKVSAFDQLVQVKVLEAARVIDPTIGIEKAIGWTAQSAQIMLKQLPQKSLDCQILAKRQHKVGNGYTKTVFFLKTWYANGEARTFNAVDWDMPEDIYNDLGLKTFIRVQGKFKLNTWTKDDEQRAQCDFALYGLEVIDTPKEHRRRGQCKYIMRQENRYENNPSSAQFRSEAECVGLHDEDAA